MPSQSRRPFPLAKLPRGFAFGHLWPQGRASRSAEPDYRFRRHGQAPIIAEWWLFKLLGAIGAWEGSSSLGGLLRSSAWSYGRTGISWSVVHRSLIGRPIHLGGSPSSCQTWNRKSGWCSYLSEWCQSTCHSVLV